MAETKFVKAYCDKAKQYYALEVKKFGSVWKVTNFTQLSEAEAKVTATEVEQSSFETNDNLIACRKCGNRRVGGCSCAGRENVCAPKMKYHFNCIYCENLKIDYSVPTEAEVGQYAGGKIKLSQGQEVAIRFADGRKMKNILVRVGWDRESNAKDVDASVVVLSPDGGERELVYFGDLEHPSGCVVHHGDDLIGGVGENIAVYLDKVPASRDRLVFVLNLYKCRERRQTFGKVKNLYIKLTDPDSQATLIEYVAAENAQLGDSTAMVIGVATRKQDGWSFKAVGRSFRADNLSEIVECCDSYI